ncbi:hypothetical protein [Fimbriimonas ginsengisoli]|uniref:Galanin n=1 Tax=Fimbriimonas ginsengisoli Gsoil 348 TaxID=661478 RepID=A0A068NS58_FIMGI|nr:hypothetical protein [Fimbriimonas ginsengisoli]AIE86388.1 hypothetical protein OP10G_3020 [Fimbriimonas ginsengisoli Gsoil 348]
MELIFVGVIVLVIVIAVFASIAAKKRREAFFGLAQSLGFQYMPEGMAEPPRSGFFDSMAGMFGPSADAIFLQRFLGFHPFGEGHSPDVANLLIGTRDGADWYLFDYSYKTETTDSEGKTSTTTHSFGVVAARVPIAFPGLSLTPENVFHRIGAKLGMQELNFELEEFNRRYFVRSADSKAAYDLLHPRAIEFLMSKPVRHWQMGGIYVMIVQSGAFTPGDAMLAFQEIRGFIGLIPDYYRQDHGFTPQWRGPLD